MNDTPTPRTDKAEFSFDTFNGVDPWEGERWIKVVPSKISAKLETELTAAREELKAVTEQRDRLAEALNKMSTAAFALNDARIDRDLLKHVTALKDLMFAAVKADEALQSIN